jgi:transposase-like protein
MNRFPTDDSCLDHLMDVRYGLSGSCPKCEREGKYHRVKKRPVYECQWCGHQISPMAGTPFAKSRTPLQKWFYAMYLFTTSRHGVPAKELQRQLGVTYKCAWRMGHEIRKYMTDVDGDGSYGGGAHVEMDETFVGGRKRRPSRVYGGNPAKDKTIVFGIVEREGSLQTYVIDRRTRKNVQAHIDKRVVKGSTISTDEAPCYQFLGKHGYKHGTVCHEDYEWKNGIYHTNTIEGFWARLKSSIRGTHIHVSKKYLPNYLGEFEYRYNMRKSPKWMFERLLGAF